MSRGAPRFREVQSFRDNLVARIAGLGLAVALGGVFLGAARGVGVGAGVAIPVAVLALVGFLLFFGELRTEVHEDALYTRVFPLTREHRFSWGTIRHCEPRTYRPLLEYGGWGVRCGRGGKAYNVSGNRGVQLEFMNGKRLLIGSQRAEELAAAINEMRSRS